MIRIIGSNGVTKTVRDGVEVSRGILTRLGKVRKEARKVMVKVRVLSAAIATAAASMDTQLNSAPTPPARRVKAKVKDKITENATNAVKRVTSPHFARRLQRAKVKVMAIRVKVTSMG